jgi:hypothetical protein
MPFCLEPASSRPRSPPMQGNPKQHRRRIYPRSSPRHRYRFDTPPGASGRPATGAVVARCTSHQSNTHSTESREVLYPWHPWFGRVVWIYRARVSRGWMVAHCGLEPQHECRGLEVPLWMFDRAVCCQLRLAPRPVVDIGALHGLAVLLAADSQPDGSPMLQAQHDSVLPEGGADENPVEPVPENPAVVVSVEANNAAMGTTAVGGAPANDSVAGANAERTVRTGVGFPIDAGGRR